MNITKKHLIYIGFFVLMVVCAQLLLLPSPYNLLPFGLAAGASLIFLTFRFPIIGLHLYLIMFLVRPQDLFPDVAVMHYPYEKVIGIVVIVSLIFTYIVKGRHFELYDVDKGVLLFLAAVAVSVVPAVWVSGAKDEFIVLFKIIMACFFTVRIANTQGKFKGIIWLYVLSIGFIALLSTINYYRGTYQVTMGIQRAMGAGGKEGELSDPNSMASTLVLGMPFIFAMMKTYRSMFVRSFLALMVAVCLWTIVITGSRGGMLGCIAMLVLVGLTSRYRSFAIIAVVCVIVGIAAVMPEQYVERFNSIVHYSELDDGTGAAESAQGRIKGLQVGLEILLTRPLTGVGIGCFSVYNHDYHGSWLQPHNLFGQLVGELGLFGLIAFSYFIYKLASNIKFIRSILRRNNMRKDFNFQMATASMISIVLLFFLGFFAHNLYRFNWYLVACFVAIMVRLVEYRLRPQQATVIETVSPPPEMLTKR